MILAFPDTKAVITCDAGTNSTGALSRANEYELLTLVTDHHMEEAQSLAHVIVNLNEAPLWTVEWFVEELSLITL